MINRPFSGLTPERVLDVDDTGLTHFEGDTYDVKPARRLVQAVFLNVPGGGAYHPLLFTDVYPGFRRPERMPLSGFDLDENQKMPMTGNQVDFPATDPITVVPLYNPIAFIDEELRGKRFTTHPPGASGF
jgi:hypothetical protein